MAQQQRKTPFLVSLLCIAACVSASCGGSSQNGGTPTPPGSGSNPPTTSPPNTTPPPEGPGNPVAKPGATDFTTEEAANGNFGVGGGAKGEATAGAAPGAAVPPAANPASDNAAPGAPGGRVADVEEGDIYRVDQNRLFYLNTYRGFLIYDLNDPKNPQRVSRLPVYGYPIEMYVSGTTVYALLRDALYLTQINGRPQFQRHNVSQLVSIDISDLKNPRVLKTIDIVGNLREGVSRKIDNTIYVVSYIPQSYFWGWRQDPKTPPKEQAWVYSFNVANPQDMKKVGESKIFEGGSVQVNDSQGNYFNRTFSEVYISATSNALMVAENWNISSSSPGGGVKGGNVYGCGSYSSLQQVHISLIDVSDPTGVIRPHVDFWTDGQITDQFKMTYVFDAMAKTGTFFGILGRQVWSASNCQGNSYTQNTLESWDVSVAGKPARLDTLDFGKTHETVRGSAFDVDRKVAYAITAQQIDPMYALDISNPRDLKVLSEINGLSGNMTVFRLVGGGKFLLGVGQDTSNSCKGFQDATMGWRPANVAVSLIDVQDLTKIKLMQRQCVAVKNADWIGSNATQDMDQAHKMLGMHEDGTLNVLTVPVYYSKRVDPQGNTDWWWYRYETAVGIMSWDLTRYDATKTLDTQTVIQNHGTFVHPNGEVRRSIVFTHDAAGVKRRMMVNLSDTHVSVADISDLANPTQQSVIEVAPYYNQIYRFGDYLVEQVQSKPEAWGSPSQDVMTFRVRKGGGDAGESPVLNSFDIGQIYRVVKHADDSLVLFRQVSQPKADPMTGIYQPPGAEALVVDMRNPAVPRLAGRVAIPTMSVPFYYYWCGVDAYWGGFWFGQESNFAMTTSGLAFYVNEYRYENNQANVINKLMFIDLTNPDAPAVSEKKLPATDEWGAFGVVADPVDPAGFYITHRNKVGESKTDNGGTFTRYKYYAQRWAPGAGGWAAGDDVNTPGRLVRTWRSSKGDRMFLSQDMTYRSNMENDPSGKPYWAWYVDYRLSLLRQIDVGGKPAAEMLGSHMLMDLSPSAILVDGDKLFMNARSGKNYFYGFGYAGGGGVGIAVPGAATSTPAPAPSVSPFFASAADVIKAAADNSSDRLIIADTSAASFNITYDQPTDTYNMQLMGTHQGKLFANLLGEGSYSYYDRGAVGGGDGILVIDVSNPAAPTGVNFLRTLGYATHIEFFGDDVYVAAGHFGLSHLSLSAPGGLPEEPTM